MNTKPQEPSHSGVQPLLCLARPDRCSHEGVQVGVGRDLAGIDDPAVGVLQDQPARAVGGRPRIEEGSAGYHTNHSLAGR